MTPHVFVRPGELRHAEWTEFDFERAVWSIPTEKMKMRWPHKVPLSRQVLAILEELKPLTGHSPYVFPAFHTWKRPMSENTITFALCRMGYGKDQMTAHGFRAMAATLLNEMGIWNPTRSSASLPTWRIMASAAPMPVGSIGTSASR